MTDKQCLFNEPWLGQCKEKRSKDNIFCCEKHAKEKCQICGEQAFTRCQASRGLMCGVPLCEQCGKGQMCLDHAGSGPLAIIRGLLNGGPEVTVFSSDERLEEERLNMIKKIEKLKKREFTIVLNIPITEQFRRIRENHNKKQAKNKE